MAVQFWPKNNTTTTPTRKRTTEQPTCVTLAHIVLMCMYIAVCWLGRWFFRNLWYMKFAMYIFVKLIFFWPIKTQILRTIFLKKPERKKKNYVCAVICYIHPLWTWDCNLCLLHSFNILEILKVGTLELGNRRISGMQNCNIRGKILESNKWINRIKPLLE